MEFCSDASKSDETSRTEKTFKNGQGADTEMKSAQKDESLMEETKKSEENAEETKKDDDMDGTGISFCC